MRHLVVLCISLFIRFGDETLAPVIVYREMTPTSLDLKRYGPSSDRRPVVYRSGPWTALRLRSALLMELLLRMPSACSFVYI
ncbi:hypothetical protein BOTBODRAFT_26003 [Botryobasidium botryosum FD-172 SS1]|uniref:Secreted protein n=1 Tax=Botryobasidium botryosum (strain FD-172 SS1) TaxID=930990 RepID=A0A067N0N2_BOTB1|nr:hypothetical protein BOTBODRAFT_26003 [Botryobasidium botryosum FD-172 SS1]